MTTTTALAAVTGIGPVSRLGIGVTEVAAAQGFPATSDASVDIRPLDNFDPADYLGKRGWKFLPPVTRAALVAARLALADSGQDPVGRYARAGVVIGTNFAVSEITDRIDRALLDGGVSGISAVECPNFAINVPASQVSIAHGMNALNITLVNLLTAGCEALLVGARALRAGRAGSVLAGAMEGLPPRGADVATGPGADAGGACLMYMESQQSACERGSHVYALLTAGVRRVLPGDSGDAAAVLSAALAEVGCPAPAKVRLCVPAGEIGQRAEETTRRWFGERGLSSTSIVVSRAAPQGSVTSVLWLAHTLAAGELDDGDLVFGVLGPQGQLILLRFTR
jgi:3-oxoacyl-[acyl-carrier-protein] synthase II